MFRSRTSLSSPDYVFIILLALLVVFGLVMLTSASSDLAQSKFGESYYYLTHQILYGFSIGIIGFFAGAFVYYRIWEKFSFIVLILGIAALLLVFTPLGFNAGGSNRWIQIGPVVFQPGEFAKLAFLIYLSAWISKSKKRLGSFSFGFIPFLIFSGIVAFLLFLQPSTTTAVILLLASLITYFVAGAKLRYISLAAIFGVAAVVGLIVATPYRLERITGFLDNEADPLGKNYQLQQALIAIGSGGVTGVGYGQSTTKLKYLPEPIGDSIFAVIGEELGFVGSVSLVFIFLLFIWRAISIARNCPDLFGRILAIGFISVIGIQAFINIGAISGLIPLTGVPLPFVSYGGTALAVFLTMSGIIVNISRHR